MNTATPDTTSVQQTTPQATTNSSLSFADFEAYIGLGGIGVPLTSLTFAVLISDRVLLKKSALIFGLTLGNFFLAFFLLTNGAYRIIFVDSLSDQTTFTYCVSTVVSLIYPTAFLVEATFLFLSGIERLSAIKAPHWFRKNWTDRNAWILSAVALFLCFATFLAGLLLPLQDRAAPTVMCGLSAMYGTRYIWFLSSITAVGGSVSAVLTIAALVASVRHISVVPLASGEAGRIRKQLQLTKSMVTVSCVDVALVVIPNIMSLLTNLGVKFPWWVRPNNSSYTHGINALVAFFAFFAFHNHFQKATIKLLRSEKLVSIIKKKATAQEAGTVAVTLRISPAVVNRLLEK